MDNQPEYRVIPLSSLKLDLLNPRLPKSLQEEGKSEEDILEYMLLDASLIELMLAIGVNGFFAGEQLLVVEEKDGKFKVIEGNRRLSAVKLLNNPELARVQKIKIEKVLEETDQRPTEIPCLVFKSEVGIHNYLGYRHITGIKEWKLLEKARYLNGLRQDKYVGIDIVTTSREIAKIIGSRMDYVRRILVGYEIYLRIEDEKFFRIRDLNDITFYFNYIADSLNKSNINDFLGVDFDSNEPLSDLNNQNLETWTKWLFEKNDQNQTRLKGTSGDLTKLNKILGKENARIAFRDRGMELERAYELTEDSGDIFREAVKKSYQYLEQADNIVHRLSDFYDELEEDLLSIRRLANKIKTAKDAAADEKF